jgi:WhiB family redox-sensing transcriptional regulator
MKPDQAFTQLSNAIRKHGAPVCQETDPETWFPQVGDSYGDSRTAKKLCNECPVKTECLTFALANNEMFGIWGGLTPKERQRIKPHGGLGGRPKTRANALKTAK